jgi:hypothetical protein
MAMADLSYYREEYILLGWYYLFYCLRIGLTTTHTTVQSVMLQRRYVRSSIVLVVVGIIGMAPHASTASCGLPAG